MRRPGCWQNAPVSSAIAGPRNGCLGDINSSPCIGEDFCTLLWEATGRTDRRIASKCCETNRFKA